MNSPQHISDAIAVDTELAKDRYTNTVDALYVATAELQGFRAADLVHAAVVDTLRDILIAKGVCTEQQYYETLTANLYESMQDLAETGAIDISTLELDAASEDEE